MQIAGWRQGSILASACVRVCQFRLASPCCWGWECGWLTQQHASKPSQAMPQRGEVCAHSRLALQATRAPRAGSMWPLDCAPPPVTD